MLDAGSNLALNNEKFSSLFFIFYFFHKNIHKIQCQSSNISNFNIEFQIAQQQKEEYFENDILLKRKLFFSN
jgi:hypothetical protein